MTHEQLDLALSALRKLMEVAHTDEEREAIALLRRQVIIERMKLNLGAPDAS